MVIWHFLLEGDTSDLGTIADLFYRMEVSAFSDFGAEALPLSYRFSLHIDGDSSTIIVDMSLGDFNFATQRDGTSCCIRLRGDNYLLIIN